MALWVVIWTKAGLCEAFTSMLEQTKTGFYRSLLLLRSRPFRKFNMATSYEDVTHRIGSAMVAIDSLNRNKITNSVEDTVGRVGGDRLNRLSLISLQKDSAIPETQVMITKDFTKWNYDTLLEIVEGPLFNHKRLEEAI
ncbi:hypothetical protein AX14_013680 [Amanita brunnescens Koide BX004]|nr:hypothetical protein AX14_013680 [Amanita brunnescens Koide BX004]